MGGEFVSNQSAYIKITANDEGIAQTHWVSHGDGVADCLIAYTSTNAAGGGMITHRVVQLKLVPLESISPVINTVKAAPLNSTN